MVQKLRRGVAIQASFLLFLTKGPCHGSKGTLNDIGKTQLTTTIAKKRFQSILALEQ